MNAPVVIFAYNRAKKLKACIDSLSSCDGHEDTEVFIFADGARDENDGDAVSRVRTYLDSLKEEHAFGRLHIVKRPANWGLAANVIDGVGSVIEGAGKVIVLEDDLTVTKDFLIYMNAALDFYRDDAKIWSVTGFTWPVSDFSDYGHDIYYSYRACSLGWGTWKDRWETVDWDMKRYDDVMSDRRLRRRFERGGRDMTRILKDQKAGLVDSWAIRWCLSQSLQDRYTVYPVRSLVKNTGNDGSGTNDLKRKTLQEDRQETGVHENGKSIRLEHLAPDDRICRDFSRYHSGFIRRLIRNLNPAGIKRQIRRLKLS